MTIGLLGALPYAIAVIAMVAANTHADRVRERRWHTVVPGLRCAAGLVLTAGAGAHAAWAVLGLTIAATGASVAKACFWCIPATFLRGEAAAAGIALVNSLGNIAGFVSAFVIGWATTISHSSAMALYVLAAVVAVGSSLILVMPTRLIDK